MLTHEKRELVQVHLSSSTTSIEAVVDQLYGTAHLLAELRRQEPALDLRRTRDPFSRSGEQSAAVIEQAQVGG